MHMVTETRQLRDGEKLTEFFNRIDWKPLFEFVRRYFGIGILMMHTVTWFFLSATTRYILWAKTMQRSTLVLVFTVSVRM